MNHVMCDPVTIKQGQPNSSYIPALCGGGGVSFYMQGFSFWHILSCYFGTRVSDDKQIMALLL